MTTPPNSPASGDARGTMQDRLEALSNELHLIASQGETPDGDGVTVNVQLWAERWADQLTTALRESLGVSALDVFRIAGGDVECCPNPAAEQALDCLRDLRECYDEALRESLGGEGESRTAIAWAVQTNNYGLCYSFSNEFLAAFPNAPVDYVPAPRAAEAVVDDAMVEAGCIAMCEVAETEWPTDYTEQEQSNCRRGMRLALTAALTAAISPPSPGAAK